MCRALLRRRRGRPRGRSRGRRAEPGGALVRPPRGAADWIDFADGSVSFWRERFARPGVVVATGGPELAAEARAAGAGTVHWDMYLRKRVGTPSEPADPALIEKRADALFDYAVSVSGCETPLIALNELWGASLPTPLTPTAERYRANVLRFVTPARRARRAARRCSSRASRSPAATRRRGGGGRRGVRHRPREVREREPHLARRRRSTDRGACACATGSRRRSCSRSAFRPPASGSWSASRRAPERAGARGCKPRSRWFDVAKWQALAVEQVARELELAHVWSWGWAQRNERSNDPDKTYAACVWLWARDASLCDAPTILGDELDADLRTGQLDLAGRRALHVRRTRAHGGERRCAREADAATASSR